MRAQTTDVPTRHELVLVGGGHSHLAVIRGFGMKPVPGVRVTVISRDVHTPYSGMLPGLIAGHYEVDDAHVDLQSLCQESGVRLIHATVTGIDTEGRRLFCEGRAPLHYSWVSFNIGSSPRLDSVPGAGGIGSAVKPIDRFLVWWHRLLDELCAQPRAMRLAIVGGGAAGVEVALACDYRLRMRSPEARALCQLTLVSASDDVPAGHNARVRHRVAAVLAERGIDCRAGVRVRQAHRTHLALADGGQLAVDEVIWALPAGAPAWLGDSALATDEQGFLLVDHSLCSLSDNRVFAAGDIASLPVGVPKSGVYAVREGSVLNHNLHQVCYEQTLLPYRPQRRFLSLLSTGDGQAIASRGLFSAYGKWVWHWKDRIDRDFMAMYRANPIAPASAHADEALRCGGCAAKVGAESLERVMKQLAPLRHPNQLGGTGVADDAAVVRLGDGRLMVQSVDYFRSFTDDPFLLGRIAAVHCISDIVAMGALPDSALAVATIAHAHPAIMEQTLAQLMAGALSVLNAEGVSLTGGHSNEGKEMAFGLSLTGFCLPEQLLPKAGLRHGQRLILCKALGTGTVFAANMHCAARGDWIESAIASMERSPVRAMQILREHGATACTDITGFGLLGHLLEMVRGARLGAVIDTPALPVLPGALDCLQRGYLSSLDSANRVHLLSTTRAGSPLDPVIESLLLDPQTAGGLLAGVDAANAAACVTQLRSNGYPEATIIGEVRDVETGLISLE